jgi:nitrate reductase gamma subunit
MPATFADVLTIATALALTGLVVLRVANRASRALSRFGDFALPVLCLVPVVSGFLVAHPRLSPIDAQVTYLAHLLSAELLLVLVPFTKLVHMTLFWSSQSVTELGWRFSPGAGHRVRVTLGKEGEPL